MLIQGSRAVGVAIALPDEELQLAPQQGRARRSTGGPIAQTALTPEIGEEVYAIRIR